MELFPKYNSKINFAMLIAARAHFLSEAGISKTRNGTGRNEMNGMNRRARKFMHRHMTANVCVPTVCRTHTVPYNLQKLSMGSHESCL